MVSLRQEMTGIHQKKTEDFRLEYCFHVPLISYVLLQEPARNSWPGHMLSRNTNVIYKVQIYRACKRIIWIAWNTFLAMEISVRRKYIFLTFIIPFHRPKSLLYFTRKRFFFKKVGKTFWRFWINCWIRYAKNDLDIFSFPFSFYHPYFTSKDFELYLIHWYRLEKKKYF